MILRPASREEVERLRAIADYQFGPGVGDCLIPDEVVVGVSPATRRIRNVYVEGVGLYLVLRASDYYFTLSIEAARRLTRCLPPPRHRVVVDPSRLLHGSVPCGAVKLVDDALRPGDEVVVVNEGDGVLGVGRLRLPPPLIVEPSCRGEAVRLRRRVE